MATTASFPERTKSSDIEGGTVLQPKFGPDGLIPCIVVDHATSEALMFAFMNAEALEYTIRNRKAAFWSRSRNRLWIKGEQSGHSLKVVDLFVDCDQDVLLLKVENSGPGACHNGYKSCFYRKLAEGADFDRPKALKLEFAATRAFDPSTVYKQ